MCNVLIYSVTLICYIKHAFVIHCVIALILVTLGTHGSGIWWHAPIFWTLCRWKWKFAFYFSTWSSLLSIIVVFYRKGNENEPWHEISNNVVCATSKASDQPAHTRSLTRGFPSCLNILWVLRYWLNTILNFKLKRGLHRLVWVYTCQNVTLLEITCRGSNNDIKEDKNEYADLCTLTYFYWSLRYLLWNLAAVCSWSVDAYGF